MLYSAQRLAHFKQKDYICYVINTKGILFFKPHNQKSL